MKRLFRQAWWGHTILHTVGRGCSDDRGMRGGGDSGERSDDSVRCGGREYGGRRDGGWVIKYLVPGTEMYL